MGDNTGGPASEMPRQPNSVLVVDDDVLVRSSLDLLLRRAGYDVVLADDGGRALGEISVRDIDLVMLDVSMPDSCGFDTLVAIKARRPALPVIMMSGGSGADHDALHRTAAKFGADAAFLKPIRSAELLALVAKLLPES